MLRYNISPANTLDDLLNALLRTNLYIAFNKPKFVFVPKPSSNPKKPRLVTHLVEASAKLKHLYYNYALHSLSLTLKYFLRGSRRSSFHFLMHF